MNSWIHAIEHQGAWAPGLFVAVFVLSSVLMIWRLEALSARGFEGTALGTLIMPYCSGMGNLLVAFVIGRSGRPGTEVMTNSLVNNVTNLTLLIGLPAIFWDMNVLPAAKAKRKKRGGNREQEINRLSLLLTLVAVLFFTGATWVLAGGGRLRFTDGVMLVGLFLFWQCFHVFDTLKTNVRNSRSFGWILTVDVALLGVGAYAQYVSIDWLMNWTAHAHIGFINADHIGWLSGWLTALPNGLLAFYYGWRGNPEIVYTSQVGDAHISIPLCIGIFALYRAVEVPPMFKLGMEILLVAAAVHFFFIAALGRLPRIMGFVLVGAYGYFLYRGLLK